MQDDGAMDAVCSHPEMDDASPFSESIYRLLNLAAIDTRYPQNLCRFLFSRLSCLKFSKPIGSNQCFRREWDVGFPPEHCIAFHHLDRLSCISGNVVIDDTVSL